MKKTSKHPEEMSPVELADATKAFEKPFAFERGRPMTASERVVERKLRRARTGKAIKKISISLGQEMLEKTDALAKKKGLNRSELISQLVAAALSRKAV